MPRKRHVGRVQTMATSVVGGPCQRGIAGVACSIRVLWLIACVNVTSLCWHEASARPTRERNSCRAGREPLANRAAIAGASWWCRRVHAGMFGAAGGARLGSLQVNRNLADVMLCAEGTRAIRRTMDRSLLRGFAEVAGKKLGTKTLYIDLGVHGERVLLRASTGSCAMRS